MKSSVPSDLHIRDTIDKNSQSSTLLKPLHSLQESNENAVIDSDHVNISIEQILKTPQDYIAEIPPIQVDSDMAVCDGGMCSIIECE